MFTFTDLNRIVVGDSIITGLTEAKLSRNGKVKVHFLLGAKAKDLIFHQMPYLNKKPNNIVMHIGTNGGPYSNKNTIYLEIKKIKELIKTHHPGCKNIFISSPVLRLGNKETANARKNYIDILKREEHNVIFSGHINELHLYLDGLHLNGKGTVA